MDLCYYCDGFASKRGMIMEQKKILWIIAAAGVFLLVVLGAALVLYTPKTNAVTIANNGSKGSEWISLAPDTQNNIAANSYNSNGTQNTQGDNFDGLPVDNSPINTQGEVASTNETQAAQTNVPQSPSNAQNATIYVDNATIYGNVAQSPDTPIDTQGGARADSVATINITTDSSPVPPVASVSYEDYSEYDPKRPETARSPQQQTSPVKKVTPAPVAPKPAKAPAPAKKQVAKTSPAKPTAPTKPAVSAKSASSSAKATVNVNVKKTPAPSPAATKVVPSSNYWVQVTALTSKKSADNARNVLVDNKIMADIFTYTDKAGKLFYRVRVGPYTTKSEAEYWKEKITAIDTFRNVSSYVVAS